MKTNYKISGKPNNPVLVFSNSLGADNSMWDELVPFLLPYFQVLQYDTRGFGGSEITTEPYTIELLGQDVINLLDELKIDEAYFCGLSMGGLIGQWLGIHHPERILKIILANTAAKVGEAEMWNNRIKAVKESGIESIVLGTMERWFSEEFRINNPQRVAEIQKVFSNCEVLGYVNCCAAIRDADFSEDLHKINLKTLVITGDEDVVTTVADAEFLVKNIPNATLTILKSRHLSATELSEVFASILIEFLD